MSNLQLKCKPASLTELDLSFTSEGTSLNLFHGSATQLWQGAVRDQCINGGLTLDKVLAHGMI